MAIILQDYERLKFLGKGSFAQIYKVRHKDLGYVRAIKVLTEEINEGEDDKIYKTFLKECSLLLRIGNGGHPNIIRIYQPRKIDGKALVEMDYIEGTTFESYVSGKGFIPIDEVYRFIRQIGSALAYCHVDCYRYMMRPEEKDLEPDELIRKYGVAHNDIHSNNIMRKDLDGSYILLDFGLAIQNDKAVKSSSRGDGAAEYIPPEKWSGKPIANEKAVDVYGMGILIYQMLAGRVPFVLDPIEYKQDSLKTLNKVRHQHENEKPADILPFRKDTYEKTTGRDDYRKDYPDWLDELVFKCLEKNPENRFHDGKELLEFFDHHMEEDQAASEKAIEDLRKAHQELEEKVKERNGSPKPNKRKGAVIFLSILSSILALTLLGGGCYAYEEITTLRHLNAVQREQLSQTKIKLEEEIARLEQIIDEKDKEISNRDKQLADNRAESHEDSPGLLRGFAKAMKNILEGIF